MQILYTISTDSNSSAPYFQALLPNQMEINLAIFLLKMLTFLFFSLTRLHEFELY